MFTSKVRTDDSKLLQELNLTARQPRREPHHAIQATVSGGLAQGPYVAARMGFEPATFHTEHHHWATMSQANYSVHQPLWYSSRIQWNLKQPTQWNFNVFNYTFLYLYERTTTHILFVCKSAIIGSIPIITICSGGGWVIWFRRFCVRVCMVREREVFTK